MQVVAPDRHTEGLGAVQFVEVVLHCTIILDALIPRILTQPRRVQLCPCSSVRCQRASKP